MGGGRHHGQHRQRGRGAGGLCASVGQPTYLRPRERPRGQDRPAARLRRHRCCWWRAATTRPSTSACGPQPELRLVQPQHGLQPLHARGQEDGQLRALRAARLEGPRSGRGRVGDGCIIGGVRKGLRTLRPGLDRPPAAADGGAGRGQRLPGPGLGVGRGRPDQGRRLPPPRWPTASAPGCHATGSRRWPRSGRPAGPT